MLRQIIEQLNIRLKDELDKATKMLDGFDHVIDAASSDLGNNTASKHISTSLLKLSMKYKELAKEINSVRTYVLDQNRMKREARKAAYKDRVPPRPPKAQ